MIILQYAIKANANGIIICHNHTPVVMYNQVNLILQ
jgi:hypothetical protein